MATSSSFKQQCPSCEAMVPIRDPNLVGRKIDCPKCKYRFVVEDPGVAEEEVEEVEDAVETSRKGAAAAKVKAGPRRRRGGDDDDDDDDESPRGRPKAKSSGGSKGLVIGLVLGGVGLALVGVVIFFLMNSSEDGPSPSPSASNTASRPSTPANRGDGNDNRGQGDEASNPGTTEGGDKPKTATPAASSALSDTTFTSLLPNDTEQVVHVNLKELVKTEYGRALFDSTGMIRPQSFQQKMGFPVGDVDRVLLGTNFSQGWTFNIIRTSAPVNLEAVKAAMKLKPAPDGAISGQDYYLMEANEWLQNLSKQNPLSSLQASALPATRSGPTAVRVHDAQTLIFADPSVLKQFLTTKPTHVSKPQADAPASDGSGGDSRQGGMMPMTPGRGGPMPASSGGPGGMRQSGGGFGGGGDSGAGDEPRVSTAYLTIHPNLKVMLDRVEGKNSLISMATDSTKAIKSLATTMTSSMELTPTESALVNPLVKAQGDLVATLGLALERIEGITLTGGLEYKTEEIARSQSTLLHNGMPALTKLLGEKTGLPFEDPGADPNAGLPGGGPGMVMPPSGMGGRGNPGMMMPGRGGSGGLTPGGRGGRGSMGDADFGPAGGGGGSRRPGGGPGGFPGGPPGGNLGPGGQPLDAPEHPKSHLESSLEGKMVVVRGKFVLDPKAHESLMAHWVLPEITRRKGAMDMASAGNSRTHDLAQALVGYRDANKQFPRGTAERPIPTTRAGRGFPPNDRVSGFAELLPFLGLGDLYSRIDLKKSWKDKDNLPAAMTLVPQFLDPTTPPSSWWYRYPVINQDVATTQFVALAGVGVDAPYYKSDDQAVAGKLGAFGYDRITKLADIKDKTSETILFVQTPPTIKRPWMAGGGATVQGVPETRSIQPFVSAQYNGKRGTMAIMADGSVRFITENISDDVFKALCTVRGGDEVRLTRDDALVPVPEGQAELRSEPTPPATPPAPTPPVTPVTSLKFEFKDYTSVEAGFMVLFPGTPVKQEATVPSEIGQLTTRVFAVIKDGVTFAVSCTELPATLPPGQNEQVLDKLLAMTAAGSGGKIASQKKVTQGSLAGREFDIQLPGKGVSRNRAFLVGQRVYGVGILPADTIPPQDQEKFLDSFKVTAKAP